jgi:hypothetical protein
MFDMVNNDLLGKALVERDRAHDARARNPRALFEALEAASRDYTTG